MPEYSHEQNLRLAQKMLDQQGEINDLRAALERTEAERDGAYRERAHLVALLAALYPAVTAPAPDVDEEGWRIAYLTINGQQATWHISPRDADLFGHVPHVSADDPRAQWDGHTTEQKYWRVRDHARDLAARPTADRRQTTSFTPPAHYEDQAGRPHCVHAVPVGPDSCADCRDLAEADDGHTCDRTTEADCPACQAAEQALARGETHL